MGSKTGATAKRKQTEAKLGIERAGGLRHIHRVEATTKRRTKSEAEILDLATSNLRKALKQDVQKNDGRVDSEKLRQAGYSDRLLVRL